MTTRLRRPRLFSRLAFAAVLAAVSIGAAAAQTVVRDHLGVPGPLRFDGADYRLAWSARPNPNYVKQEYLPEGQSPKRYGRMLMLEVVTGDLTPMAAAAAQVRTLNARKAHDPLVNMSLVKNDATGEVLLDFVLGAKDESGQAIVEWNAYRYSRAGGVGGVMLYAISRRAYGDDDARAFLRELKGLRPGQIAALAAAALPMLQPAR